MRFPALCALALPIVATATVIDVSARDPCYGGQYQCCANSLESTPENVALLSYLTGFALPNVGGLIGCELSYVTILQTYVIDFWTFCCSVTCTPILTMLNQGQQCNAQMLCCMNNNYVRPFHWLK